MLNIIMYLFKGRKFKKARVFGLLICIIAILGGCTRQLKIKHIEPNVENEKSTPLAEAPDIDTSSLQLEIGATEQRDFWTQTLVYPSNIDDTFVIDVCLPDDYDENSTYPVVYLTDCYWRREDYRAIKELYQSGDTKEFILIGIGYLDDYDFNTVRIRDLIEEPDQFLDMIVNGVIPYIESNYKIDGSDRTFCGASYGGFFMIYSLFQSDGLTRDVFKNYVLASPTFRQYTGGLPLADYEDLYRERTDVLNANIYLTVGELENGYDFLIPIRNFVSRIEKRAYSGLNLTYKVYEGKDHYTVWVPSLLEGLELYLAE